MPPTPEAIAANDALLEALSTRYRDEILDLHDNLYEWIRNNRSASTRLLIAATDLQSIQELMRRAGLGLYLRPVRELLQEAIDAAPALLPDGIPFEFSTNALDQVLEGVTLKMGAVSDQAIEKVQQLVMEMASVPVTLREASSRLSATTGLLKQRADTIVSTGLAQAQRALHEEAAQAIPVEERLRWYAGPNDQVIRHFCKAIEGKALTDTQIGKLDNRQGMSVLNGGGGYNCRHHWIPISRDYAELNKIPLATSRDIDRANRRH